MYNFFKSIVTVLPVLLLTGPAKATGFAHTCPQGQEWVCDGSQSGGCGCYPKKTDFQKSGVGLRGCPDTETCYGEAERHATDAAGTYCETGELTRTSQWRHFTETQGCNSGIEPSKCSIVYCASAMFHCDR
jgi:hypothetical protein